MGQGGSTKNLACTLRVRMKEEESIKRERGSERGDQKFVRENTVAVWTISVTIFNQYILEHTSSDCAEEKFT